MCAIIGLPSPVQSPRPNICGWLLSSLILFCLQSSAYSALFLASIHFNVHVQDSQTDGEREMVTEGRSAMVSADCEVIAKIKSRGGEVGNNKLL